MSIVRIYADFHNADEQGRLRLNCVGTIEDLARSSVELRDGEKLVLYSEELEADGVVAYSASERLWVAAIDWHQIRELDGVGVTSSGS
jgi:hypothetical protein